MAKFSNHVCYETLRLLVGKKIGSGAYRVVYECNLNPKLVVKIERNERDFANVSEWEIWKQLSDTPLAKWFAPCRYVSPCGTVLLQDKTKPIHEDEIGDLPKLVPSIMGDLHYKNWGRINGRVVCHDYGNFKAASGFRLKKAVW